jgi:regulator of replication initiation timing
LKKAYPFSSSLASFTIEFHSLVYLRFTRSVAKFEKLDLNQLRNLVRQKMLELGEVKKELGEKEEEMLSLRKENAKLKDYLASMKSTGTTQVPSSSFAAASVSASTVSFEELEEKLRSQEALIASLRVRLAQKESHHKEYQERSTKKPIEVEDTKTTETGAETEENLILTIRREMGVGLTVCSSSLLRSYLSIYSHLVSSFSFCFSTFTNSVCFRPPLKS